MIDRVIVQPNEHHIVIRPSIDGSDQAIAHEHVIVHEGVQVVEVGIAGPPGPAGAQGPAGDPGTGGDDVAYVHTQIAASNVWTINHNLGKFPSITVIDSGDNVVWGGPYHYVDANTVVLNFSVPFSGKAYLN